MRQPRTPTHYLIQSHVPRTLHIQETLLRPALNSFLCPFPSFFASAISFWTLDLRHSGSIGASISFLFNRLWPVGI
jgi:hypothetical protein